MKAGASMHMVKLMTAVVFLLKLLGLLLYVRNHYQIDRKIVEAGEPIKQKWNGFSQHMAFVVLQHADIVILTLFATLKNVSVYTTYFLIANGVTQIVMRVVTGLESLFDYFSPVLTLHNIIVEMIVSAGANIGTRIWLSVNVHDCTVFQPSLFDFFI